MNIQLYIIMAAVWGGKLIGAITYLPETSRLYLSGTSEWQTIYTAKHIEKEKKNMMCDLKQEGCLFICYSNKRKIPIHIRVITALEKLSRLNLSSKFACTI